MFVDHSALLLENSPALHYGVAVTDIDQDGAFEPFICNFDGNNKILKWDGQAYRNIAPPALADPGRQAIGICAADIDRDGREEIYVLNTDTFAFGKQFADRLFRYEAGRWIDLFSLPEHQSSLNLTAGRSVACVDRRGEGAYGFFVANYGGPIRFYEMDGRHRLVDLAPAIGLGLVTGGRAVVSLPLFSDRMDIFAHNENSPNFLFRNRGDGQFEEYAAEANIADPKQHGRGVAVLDANGDGEFDFVCGNWEGPHRLYLQTPAGTFLQRTPRLMAIPGRVRTVIAADFDNDGYEEIFFHNIGEPNRLFAYRDHEWAAVDTGDAWEPEGLGTGAAYGDFDGDGRLELLLSHGESQPQPLSLFQVPQNGHHYLRVMPLTRFGAPARGAIVRLRSQGRTQIRAIDAGSGYLCQMEPVAHFGLGASKAIEQITIQWPDGARAEISAPQADQLLRVPHPRR